MTIERKTVVDQIEICRDGAVRVRMAKLIIDNGVEINCQWHRTSVEPDGDPVAQMEIVNAHLVEMGEAPVSAKDVEDVVKYHTFKAELSAAEVTVPKAKG